MDDEKFFSWLDGELEPEEARRVAEKVAASPELSARAELHRGLAARLRGAFDPVIGASSEPPRFASSATNLTHLAALRQRAPMRSGIPQWAALAAALAFGLVVGSQLSGPAAERSPVMMEGGRLVAAASLEQSLDTLPAGSANGATRIGLTFRDRAGEICRSFSGPFASGLACRSGDDWELRGLFPAGEGASSDYRMAAGQHPQLAALIDETIKGEPFDARQEKAALESGWR